MISSLQTPLAFGLIAAFVTTLGLMVVSLRAEWSARHASLFALVAGGMLVTLTLLHIAPHALADSADAPNYILAGFLGGLLLSQMVRLITGEPTAPDGVSKSGAALAPILAIGFHSFIDGMVYAVSFAANYESGLYAAAGLIMHEFPEGIIAFAILRGAGVSSRMSFVWAFLAAAFTTPLGVLVSGPFIHAMGADVLPHLFALSAGLLLFVATGPLLAPIKEQSAPRALTAVGVGVVIALGLALGPLQDGHVHSGHGHHNHTHDHPNFARPVFEIPTRPE
ncbi:MAG: ZIP family metal transporter [Pseudomonadota bacterium]